MHTAQNARQLIEAALTGEEGLIVAYRGDGEGESPWAEFAEANRDMDPEQLAEIKATVLRGETYHGGGGAAGEYWVWRVDDIEPDAWPIEPQRYRDLSGNDPV